MRALFAIAIFVSGCSAYDGEPTCDGRCKNVARIFAVDSAGNPLTISTVTENRALFGTQASCELTFIPMPLPAAVTSNCRRFGVDIVSTDGKRFSGVIDVSQGNDVGPVCGTTCKTKEVTVPLE